MLKDTFYHFLVRPLYAFPVNFYLIVNSDGELFLLDTSVDPPKTTPIPAPLHHRVRQFCSSCPSGYNALHIGNHVIIPSDDYIHIVDVSNPSNIKPAKSCNIPNCSPFVVDAGSFDSSPLTVYVQCRGNAENTSSVDIRTIKHNCKTENVTIYHNPSSSLFMFAPNHQVVYFFISNGVLHSNTLPGNNEQVIQVPAVCVNVNKITPFGTSGFILECSNGTHINLTSFYNLSSAEFEPGDLLQDHHRGTLVTSPNNTLLASWSSVDGNFVISDISDRRNPQYLSPVNVSTGKITSLCFVQVQGYPHIVYAVDKAGLYSYNITKGTDVKGVSESNHACTAPGCLGLQSPTDDYVLAANAESGATFYNLNRSTKHGPVSKDVKVSRMLTLVRRNPPDPNPTSTPSSGGSNTAAIVVPILIAFVLVVMSIVIGVIIIGVYWWYTKNRKR